MNAERQLIISTFKNELELIKAWLILSNKMTDPKDPELSKKARREGNNLYLKSSHDSVTHEEIFRYYCESIALAPNGSEELALAYGNRSAFLQHINKYKHCIQDVDRALSLTNSVILKVKLMCRKAECSLILGLSEYINILEKAKILVDKTPGDKNKLILYELISKTQNVMNNLRQGTKKKIEKSNSSKVMIKFEATNIFDSVDIKYSEKHGRYLVAKRDFLPGEIIFAEKLYTSCLGPKNIFTHCYHCMSTAWSGIPCEYCNWVMFCSENCKKEATEKYHDIECPVMLRLRYCFDLANANIVVYDYHLSIRMLIMGYKEAGNIDRMKDDLKIVDQCIDKCFKGFKNGEKFYNNTFKSLYSLNNQSARPNDTHSEVAAIVLTFLVKYTRIFEETFKLKKIEDLINEKDVVFLGSLLIKLHKIKVINSFAMSNMLRKECNKYENVQLCAKNLCCMKGVCISSTASLFNHSCFPNVRRCFTDDQKIIIYASHPVKKNSQLFDSYYPIFYLMPQSIRQESLEQYNFICDCPPCKQHWPPLLKIHKYPQESYPFTEFEENLLKDNKHIFMSIDENKTEFTKKDRQILSSSIVKAFESLSQPSLTTCLILRALEYVCATQYSFKDESFGKCG